MYQRILVLLVALITISQGYGDGAMAEEMFQDGPKCKDRMSNCVSDLHAYCESHAIVKEDYCQKTCGFCTPDPPPAYVTAEPKITVEEMENIKATCLAAHNAKRSLHEMTPLMTYDMALARRAQTYVEYVLENNMKFDHDGFRKYNGYEDGVGENLFGSSSSDATSADAVTSWYNEINNYNFATGTKLSPEGGDIGHFTQLVWASSTKLGCGMAKSDKGTYVVSRYLPAGNMDGSYTIRVHELKGIHEETLS
ncbi:uncharacterized protein [Clytia hemisphaerica]|uniref:Uncharacterized protein n=1 Tax=Clytia hemisphaerica TaxID=252671 RepID=A0A7M5UXU2_9CNID